MQIGEAAACGRLHWPVDPPLSRFAYLPGMHAEVLPVIFLRCGNISSFQQQLADLSK